MSRIIWTSPLSDASAPIIEENRPWLEGFNDYYHEEMAPLIADFDAERKANSRPAGKLE